MGNLWSLKQALIREGAHAIFAKAPDDLASADKIINNEPDGDGTFTKNASSDGFNFTASAVVGASFRITMISSTAATAWWVSEVVSGLAAATGEHVAE